MTVYGSSEDKPKPIPTLRQYLKQNGGVCPTNSLVTRIFKPNKYKNYTLVTDHNFRVIVSEGDPLFDILDGEIDGMREREECLRIWIDDASRFCWSLRSEDSYRIDWEGNDYGFTLSGAKKRTTEKSERSEKRRNPPAESPVDPGLG